VPAIIVTTELLRRLSSECIVGGNTMAVTCYASQFGSTQISNNEFVFVVDCSGSMSGERIQRARDCLQIFIRSLPSGSFFNVIRFGSQFESLFHSSSLYTEANVNRALTLAANMQANLGGTNLHKPRLHVLGQGRSCVGLRQLFILTDGEVDDTDRIIQLASSHRSESRIFAIGIGGGADAGLIEGLANATGGRCDYVISNEDLSSKVIPQLQTSLSPSLTEVAVHVADNSSIDVSPFPILPISQSVSSTIFVKLSEPIEEGTGVLMSGDCCGHRQDFVIESRPARIDATLLDSRYAYEALRRLEHDVSRPEVFARCASLSVSSGVLCNETAFVGLSQSVHPPEPAPYGAA
jgi:hypothetical protein